MSEAFDDDHILVPTKKKHEEVHIDFTPMIDAMFLLLMFNMFMYVIAGSSDFDIPRVKFARGEDTHDAITVILRSPNAEGKVFILTKGNDKEENLSDATPEDVRGLLTQIKTQGGRNTVVIKAERKVPIRDVMEIATIVGEVMTEPKLLFAVQHAEPGT
jgi:biopolymer transport protein ExbD